MKLSLYRSLIFWSGLLLMGFVVWAWWDSTRWRSLASYHNWMLEHVDCGVVASWNLCQPIQSGKALWRDEAPRDYAEGEMRITRPLFFSMKEGESEDTCQKRYLQRYGEVKSSSEARVFYGTAYGAPGDWACYIPHWCLLAAVAAPWMGLLVWRERWRRKRMSIAA